MRTPKKMNIATPYYLIHERNLLRNLRTIQRVNKASGARFVLALKCFSTWCVFNLMRPYLNGVTTSSLYEVRLGREKFAKEVHAYSVAFSECEIDHIKKYADKVIFNSIAQLKRFHKKLTGMSLGLRINPGVSFSRFDLADPGRRFSRLGVTDKSSLHAVLPLISGVMFHFNCENDNFSDLSSHIDKISHEYAAVLEKVHWVSLGGGIYFTKKGYPLAQFSKKLKEFSARFNVHVYLEPGEAVVTQSAELVTRVLDVVHNQIDIAIVDASSEAHMLDLLVYRTQAKIGAAQKGKFRYMVAGRSCLAGDVFGTFGFRSRLKVGSVIRIQDAAGYTMVKKNWFNGLQMPSIVLKRLDGKLRVIRQFTYNDFVASLS